MYQSFHKSGNHTQDLPILEYAPLPNFLERIVALAFPLLSRRLFCTARILWSSDALYLDVLYKQYTYHVSLACSRGMTGGEGGRGRQRQFYSIKHESIRVLPNERQIRLCKYV